MTVSRDIILDLLPVYLAGEASAATRVLVEEFAASDRDIADRIHAERRALLEGFPTAAAPLPLELKTLKRTRRLLSLQRWLFGLALAAAAVGLSFEYRTSGSRVTEAHLMLRDYPMTFGSALAISAVCWVGYAILRRRIRAAGF